MIYTFKPNYFIATLGWSIEFDDKWEFEANTESHKVIMQEIGAIPKIVKKSTKK